MRRVIGLILLLGLFATANRAANPFITNGNLVGGTWIDQTNPTTNHGLNTYIRVGDISGYEGLLGFPDLTDSLVGRTCTLAYLIMTVQAVSTQSDDSIYLQPTIRIWEGGTATWNNAKGGGEPIAWTTAGCWSAGNDYRDTIACSASVYISVSDSLVMDITDAVNYGWTDFVLRDINCGNAKYIDLNKNGPTGSSPYVKAWWEQSNNISNGLCNDAGYLSGTNTAYDVSRLTMPDFSAYLDSAKLRLIGDYTGGGGGGDTVWAWAYKEYSNDSSLIEVSDSVLTRDEASCGYYYVHFSGTSLLLADSNYYIGPWVHTDGSGTYRFCCTSSVEDTSRWGTSSTPPDPVGGLVTSGQNCPCVTAYFTAYAAQTTGQVIIIGSCESDETPFYIGNGTYASIPRR